MQSPVYSKAEKMIFFGCFFSYFFAYIGRLNLASALPEIMKTFSLTSAQAGLIQTVFAVVYAAGQLVNGLLTDRISARRHITLGLFLSGAFNLSFSFCTSYGQLLLLWALNGAAQSMLWTPIVKLIAEWFQGKKRDTVSFFMCVTFILGHFVAWAISGVMASLFSWRLSFAVPAGILFLTALLSFLTLRDKDSAGAPAAPRAAPEKTRMPLGTLLFGTGLWLTLLACLATGFAREGVMTWAPSIITELYGSGSLSAAVIPLIIPLINLLGILFGQALIRRANGRLNRVMQFLLALAAISAAALSILRNGQPALLLSFLLGVLCALMYSVSTMESVMVPLEYCDTGRVSFVAGLCDCMIYIGASLVSVLSGALQESAGQQAVYLSWAAAALIAFGAIALNTKHSAAKESVSE